MQKKKQRILITVAIVLVCVVLLIFYVNKRLEENEVIRQKAIDFANNTETSRELAALKEQAERQMSATIEASERMKAGASGDKADYYRKKLSELVAQETRTDTDILTIQALISLLEDEGYKLYYDESTNTVVG